MVSSCFLQHLVQLAELHEDVVQQLHSVEAVKMQMAEQKLAEQTRLAADLDVRLQAACCTLDCSAGDVTTDLTDQPHMSCAVASHLAWLYIRSCTACTIDSVAVLVWVSAKTWQIILPMPSLDSCLYIIVSVTI